MGVGVGLKVKIWDIFYFIYLFIIIIFKNDILFSFQSRTEGLTHNVRDFKS